MRRMVTALLVVAILTVGAGTALAGAHGAPAGGPFRLSGFALTAEQVVEIQALRERFWAQVELIRERIREICGPENSGTVSEEVGALREDLRAEILAILTPEQVEEFEARGAQAARRAHRRGVE